MSEQTQATTGNTNSATRRKWALLITGTAVLLLAAGVMLQVTRPTSAFPEDGNPGSARATPAARSAAGDQDPKRMRKVAVVDKEIISYDELAAECVARAGKEVLENLINRKIIQQACDNQAIEISDAEVSREIKRNAEKFGLAVDQWMGMLESERNVTPMQYRRDIIWPKLALQKLAGEDVKITKKMIDEAYDTNYGPRVEARAIILNNQRRAQEVWEKVQANPDDFEELAKQHSIDPASRSMGGKIPAIQRHSNPKALEEAAFKLKSGKISPVIQVGLSQWIILKGEGRTTPTVKEMTHDIQEILIEQLKEEKTAEAVARVFEKLKSEARVTNYVTNVSSGGERRQNGTKSAGSAGTISQTSGTASKRSASGQMPDAASAPQSTRTSPSGKSAGRSATSGKAAARSADDE
jgi:foldase protein PrsA